LKRNQAVGEMYPIGNIPGRIVESIEDRPRLALTVIDDGVVIHMAREAKRIRGTALTPVEIGSIPENFPIAEWYQDSEDPALLLAWQRSGNLWVKVVVRLDQKVGRGVANRIVSGGVVETRNIEDVNRYKKI
jgi:hypothetical protein